MLADLSDALAHLRSRLTGPPPRVAIILGSGLSGMSDSLGDPSRILYSQIPGFPETTVTGHRGELILGKLGEVPVLLQSGRFHLYEGHDPASVAMPVRLFARLGVRWLIVTNAAGALNPIFRVPTLMLIADHVNLMWRNPLIGNALGGDVKSDRVAALYDSELRLMAREVALRRGIQIVEGVYAGVLGPSYETSAEVRMLRKTGCDAVGMSTVPEVIEARASGMKVLGVSTLTNAGTGLSKEPLSHEDVLDAGRMVAADLRSLLEGVVEQLGADY